MKVSHAALSHKQRPAALAGNRADAVPGDVSRAAWRLARRARRSKPASGRSRTVAIRDFGLGRHRTVDDTPAGGGAGMVMRADVLGGGHRPRARRRPRCAAHLPVAARRAASTRRSPRELAAGPGVMLLAGRFEGVDERVIAARRMREVSIGDYVLSGGELAAMVLIDACVRLLPGVVGAAESLAQESFEGGLLEYPQYTKPREWEGRAIPEVLLVGRPQEDRRVAPPGGGAPDRRAPARSCPPEARPRQSAGLRIEAPNGAHKARKRPYRQAGAIRL